MLCNIWVRERTKVIDTICNVRKMKWSWAGHISRLKDDRWTLGVPIYSYDKGDQPSGGETTWTNTGGARAGRQTREDVWLKRTVREAIGTEIGQPANLEAAC